jgi:sporulation-control protein
VVFKKMMRAFGAGGPIVDTVLTNPNTRPGLPLNGQVDITGGDHEVTIEHVALGLVTGAAEFLRIPVTGTFRLAAGERRSLPFTIEMPWETPVTAVFGQRLNGMSMGVRTELAVANAVDKGDLDEIQVHPLPAQEKILEAFATLGFRFAHADLEQGTIFGVRQTLPFYQEIEFYPPPQYTAAINEVEVTFVADPEGVEVILEFDKRGGFLSEGHDSYGRFRVPHATVESTDWTSTVNEWVRHATDRYASLRSLPHGYVGGHGSMDGHIPSASYGPGGYSHSGGYGHSDSHGHSSDHGHGSNGFGAGAMVAGVAGGVVGGMLMGEVAEEIFQDDEE